MIKKIFSGLRPTGDIQLGNYLGAIRHWVNSQENHNDYRLFCIVDLHALTTIQGTNIKELSDLITATYLACGLDPQKNIIFCQSHVSEHSELSWLLSCHTPLGWLNRMTQFKEKAKEGIENASLGLYAYPTLMAADILLYHTTHVPVGEDQKQHVELARDIAISINNKYGTTIFTVPEPTIAQEGSRIMSLRDGLVKMGKSDRSDMGRINLTDTPDIISKKIKKAKSDSTPIPDNINDLEERPEAKNLLIITSILDNTTLEKTIIRFSGKNFSDLKSYLIDLLIAKIEPIQKKIDSYMKDRKYLNQVLKHGSEKAKEIANPNMKQFLKAFKLA